MTFWDYDGLSEIREELNTAYPRDRNGKYPSTINRNNGIVRSLLLKYLWVADSIDDTVHLYSWNGFYYQEVFKPDMAGIVKRLYNLCEWQDYKTVYGSEVLDQMKADVHLDTRDRHIQINNHPEIIPFKNGLLDISTMTFLPPNPEIYFTFTLDIPYVPDMNCSRFQAFINRILPNDADRKDILCYLGYSLTSSIHKKIAHVWTGAGRNGKTTLTNILTMLLGMKNTCHVSLDQLMGENRFVMIRLKGRQLNLGSEITYDDIEPNGIRRFKEVITNRFISGEKKGKDAEEWINITKHIFDVNELPLPRFMMDFAFWRRFHVIPFKIIIPEAEIIDNLDVAIFQEEGPQIASYLLSFLPEIDEILIETPEETEKRWYANTISVVVFIRECCEIDSSNYFTPISDVYDLYCHYCSDNAKKSVSQNQFTRIVTRTAFMEHSISSHKKGFQWGYTLRVNYIPILEPPTDHPTDHVQISTTSLQK